MTRPAFVLGVVLVGASALAACDLVLPEEGPELATYYVSSNRLTGAPATNATVGFATRIAIEYVSPDGVKYDTLLGARASWSRVYERSALGEFRLKATNLTPDTTRAQLLKGFAGATLMLGGKTIAHDSSKTVASVDAASAAIEGAQ